MSYRAAAVSLLCATTLLSSCDSLGYKSVDRRAFEQAKRGTSALRESARKMEQVPDGASRRLTADMNDSANQLNRAADALATGENLAQLGLYYTVEPLVALDSDLDATAIPALAVNWRPFEETAMAFQGVLGGAVNPGSSGDQIGAALGFGVSHPVSNKGAISFGHIFWSDSGGGDNGWYIGINLGDFTISSEE